MVDMFIGYDPDFNSAALLGIKNTKEYHRNNSINSNFFRKHLIGIRLP